MAKISIKAEELKGKSAQQAVDAVRKLKVGVKARISRYEKLGKLKPKR